MSRKGRNNRWSHDRQKNKMKAERRRAQANRHLHVVEDEEPQIIRPPGYVSPYASERRAQQQQKEIEGSSSFWEDEARWRSQKGRKGKRQKVSGEAIKELATTLFGGTYYCVGDRKADSELRATAAAE